MSEFLLFVSVKSKSVSVMRSIFKLLTSVKFTHGFVIWTFVSLTKIKSSVSLNTGLICEKYILASFLNSNVGCWLATAESTVPLLLNSYVFQDRPIILSWFDGIGVKLFLEQPTQISATKITVLIFKDFH